MSATQVLLQKPPGPVINPMLTPAWPTTRDADSPPLNSNDRPSLEHFLVAFDDLLRQGNSASRQLGQGAKPVRSAALLQRI